MRQRISPATSRLRLPTLLLLAGFVLLSGLPLAAQKSVDEAAEVPDFTPYERFRTHQPEHDAYNAFVGSWVCDMTVLLQGTPPVQGTLRSTFDAQWVFGERYLQADVHRLSVSEHFKDRPVDVEDLQIFGYSVQDEAYYNVIFQTEDTIPGHSTGTLDAESGTLTFTVKEGDPVTGDHFIKTEIFRPIDADTWENEVHFKFMDGSEIKVAWCTYHRKK